jgi:hypothetical protein
LNECIGREYVPGNVLATPALDRRYRLDEGVVALSELEQGHSRGKSVVVMA